MACYTYKNNKYQSREELESFLIEETIQFQKEGVTLLPNGFYHNGKVYINQDLADLSTPIHEFSHSYNQLLKNERPEFYKEGLNLIEKEGKQYIDFVKANQPNLQGDALLEEALAQAVGDAGQRLIEKQSGLFQWLQEAWNSIKEMLGLSSYTIDQVRNMSLQEYTNAVAVDLLRGDRIKATPSRLLTRSIESRGGRRSSRFESEIKPEKIYPIFTSKNILEFSPILNAIEKVLDINLPMSPTLNEMQYFVEILGNKVDNNQIAYNLIEEDFNVTEEDIRKVLNKVESKLDSLYPLTTNFQINATEQELQQIKDEAIANGTFMKAPNGKDTNLNERQWLIVRGSNFRSWFGDWLNDPQNASKVVDQNGEPLIVFHGTNGEFTTFDPKMIGINANAEGAGFYFTDDKAVAEGYMNNNKDNPSLYEVFLNVRKPIDYGDKMFKKGDVKKIIKQVIKNEVDFDPEGVKDYKDSFMSNFVDTYSIKEATAIEEVANILMDDETKIDFISGLGNAVGSQSMVLDAVNKALGYDSTFAKGYSGKGEAGGNIYITWSPNQIKSATDNVGTFSPETNDIRYQKSMEAVQRENQKLATFTKANEIGLELFPTQEKINEITQEIDSCGI